MSLSQSNRDSTKRRKKINPNYRKKIQYLFGGWFLTIPSSVFLIWVLYPLICFDTGIKIAFGISMFSLGISSLFLSDHYGAQMKRSGQPIFLENEDE